MKNNHRKTSRHSNDDGQLNSPDRTSLITVLSSYHGRLRREQRDIEKRDLQKALKYGTVRRAWGGAWRVEYDGITFITDETRRREITAFPSPLPTQELSMNTIFEHQKTKHLLQLKPKLSTSHTVLVMDESGSMLAKKGDVFLYRDCHDAAISITALELVAEQIINETATNSDLVSLVKFRETATIAFEREPIGWPLYNQLLSHRDSTSGSKFQDRQLAPYNDARYAQSNYLAALDKAMEVMESSPADHDPCALLFFCSDGRPTDPKHLGIPYDEFATRLNLRMSHLASKYRERLTVAVKNTKKPLCKDNESSGIKVSPQASGVDLHSIIYGRSAPSS